MSKKSRKNAKKKKKKQKKKNITATEATTVTATAIIDEESVSESSEDNTESIFDKKDAKKYFKGFLKRHPGTEEADPAHEAAQWYMIDKSLKHSRDYPLDELEIAVKEYFTQLAHKWKIYSQIYPEGPEIPADI